MSALAERFLAVPHTSMSHIKRLSNLAFQTDFSRLHAGLRPGQHECLASPEQQAAMAAYRAEQAAKRK